MQASLRSWPLALRQLWPGAEGVPAKQPRIQLPGGLWAGRSRQRRPAAQSASVWQARRHSAPYREGAGNDYTSNCPCR